MWVCRQNKWLQAIVYKINSEMASCTLGIPGFPRWIVQSYPGDVSKFIDVARYPGRERYHLHAFLSPGIPSG
jgi:hypothetical protein